MAGTDLYAILYEYAQKNNSARVNKNQFFEALTVMAQQKAQKSPDWKIWAERPHEKFKADLNALAAQKLVSVDMQKSGKVIHVLGFYAECVRELWSRVNERPEDPFPDGSLVKDDIPSEIIRSIDFETEFHELLRNPPEEDLPVLKLVFSEVCGAALTVFSIVSAQLLEAAVGKLRYYLGERNFKPLFITKMTSKLPNLITQIESSFTMLILNPYDCCENIKAGDSNGYMIWSTLCNFIQEALKAKKNAASLDIAILQSAYVVKSFATYYRAAALENNDAAQFLAFFESNMNKEPYVYAIRNIMQFADDSGKTLVDRFGRDALLAIIKKKSTVAPQSEAFPEIISFVDAENERWFVCTVKLFLAFEYMCKDTRGKIHKRLNARWYRLLKNYASESAMKNDPAFNKLITTMALEESPQFVAIYNDKKFLVTKKELQSNPDVNTLSQKYFSDDIIKPLYKILGFERTAIKKSINASLPFWYSIPLIVAFIRLFKGYEEEE